MSIYKCRNKKKNFIILSKKKKKKFIIEYVSQKIAIQQYVCNFFCNIFLCLLDFLGRKVLPFFPKKKKKKKVFNSFSPNLLMYATVNYEPKLLGPYN